MSNLLSLATEFGPPLKDHRLYKHFPTGIHDIDLLRCPLCPGAFRTHMEFMNHVRITHPSTPEQNLILRSHVYASNVLNSENSSSSQLAPPQYQSVILRPSGTHLLENRPSAAPNHAGSQGYSSRPLSLGNLPSSQSAAPHHAGSQSAILGYSSRPLSLGNLPSSQSEAPHHAGSQSAILGYSSRPLSLGNLSSSVLRAAPPHASSVTLRPHGYPSRPLSLGNLSSSVQRAAPPHASLQSATPRPSMYGFGPLSLENSPSTQSAAPHHANVQGNNSGVILPASSSNANHSIRSWRRMEGGNQIGGPSSAFAGANEPITVSTRPFINQLDVPISANANEIINLVDDQNDVDLNLRL